MADSGSDDEDLLALLGTLLVKQRDVDRVFQKMVQAPYRGKVPFNHLSNMDPDDFAANDRHVEIIRWFRDHPSKFILFETNNRRVAVVGVRIPGVKMCLQYQTGSCTDPDCYRFHICRKFIGGYCSEGTLCPRDHHFQSAHNRQLLQKMKLDTFGDDDVRTIFATSHLRVCDIHNQTDGHCTYNDRCTRIHLCEKYVRGTCTDGACPLGHRVDSSDHSRRLLGLYALDDKPQAEVVTNLLISRRKPDGVGGGMGYAGARAANPGLDLENVLDLLERLRPHSKKDDKSESSSYCAPVSVPRPSSTVSSLPGPSNPPLTREEMREQRLRKLMPQSAAVSTDSSNLQSSADADLGSSSAAAAQSVFQTVPAAAANSLSRLDDDNDGDDKSDDGCPAVVCKDDDDDDTATAAAGSGEQPVWQVEVFGAWRDLTSRESSRLETQFCDGNRDNASIPIMLEEIGHASTLTVNFETMLATLNYGLEILEDMKVKRSGSSIVQWTWYWQEDDNSWHTYSAKQNSDLESARRKKSPKVIFMSKKFPYEVSLKNMMQKNPISGRMRRVRCRPTRITNN